MNARAIAILFWILAAPPLAYLLVNAIGATIEHFNPDARAGVTRAQPGKTIR